MTRRPAAAPPTAARGACDVVIAFRTVPPHLDLDLDVFRDELAIVIESQYDVDGIVDVAVREVGEGIGGKGPGGGDIRWGSRGSHGV